MHSLLSNRTKVSKKIYKRVEICSNLGINVVYKITKIEKKINILPHKMHNLIQKFWSIISSQVYRGCLR